jgi:AcrR family transcriptional regulator
MGTPERREREKQELRQRILDTARELFVAEGYDAVTMRKIAEKIEYSATAIYVHFKDKDALFKELCCTDFLKFAHRFHQALSTDDALGRLRALAHAYVAFATEHPEQYRLMFMTPHPPQVMADQTLIEQGNPEQDSYGLLKMVVTACIEQGLFRSHLTNADHVAQIAWAGIHGLVALRLTMKDDPWVPWQPLHEATELAVDVLMHGFVKEGRHG